MTSIQNLIDEHGPTYEWLRRDSGDIKDADGKQPHRFATTAAEKKQERDRMEEVLDDVARKLALDRAGKDKALFGRFIGLGIELVDHAEIYRYPLMEKWMATCNQVTGMTQMSRPNYDAIYLKMSEELTVLYP